MLAVQTVVGLDVVFTMAKAVVDGMKRAVFVMVTILSAVHVMIHVKAGAGGNHEENQQQEYDIRHRGHTKAFVYFCSSF